MKRVLIWFFAGIAFLPAGEVDQYLAWRYPITDSTIPLNRKYNAEIQVALQEINADPDLKGCSCQKAAGEILKYFGVGLNSKIEKWIKSTDSLSKLPDNEMDIVSLYRESVYHRKSPQAMDRLQGWALVIQLDEIINVNGIYFGVDKLTHFTASGFAYYQLYLFAMGKGSNQTSARRNAVRFGVLNEYSILGEIISGVFSYADLESNYQGLLFALDLCSDVKPHLENVDGKWRLSDAFDIRHYVNPYWDEAYYPSFFTARKSATVLGNLPKFCEDYRSEHVQEIFAYYDSIKVPGYSVLHLDSLIQRGELPDPTPFSIQSICE